MEVARRQHDLAELRIEADQSPVAFSDPCAAGRKRRCLFPSSFSPRKKMLVELPPFSAPVLSPPASAGRSAGAFSSALSPSSGSNRGFTFRASTESDRSGALAVLASLERPLTPMGSTASGGFGVSSRPPFSPGTGGAGGTRASAFLASPPNPACTGLSGGNDGGELAFLASPKSAGSSGSSPVAKVLSPAGAGAGIGSGGHLVVSPPRPLVLAPPLLMPASPAEGSTLWSRRRGNKRQREEKPQIALPPNKVANTGASAASDREPSPGAILSVSSSTRPCCTFVSSPAKATKEEANRRDVLTALRSSSTAGTCCTFVTSPTRPSAVDKASGPDRGARLAGVRGDGGAGAGSPVTGAGAQMVVSVTFSCGARKEFCFDHCH